jgi:methionyl-tRNA formyltransferase
MRVLFWGTPGFALPTLRALLGESHDVVAVVTQPDRPAGRGRELRPSPVKQLAVEEKIPVVQPIQPVGTEFIKRIRDLDPEISVVVAYGQILKPEVLALPPLGSINVHASLLPRLRGAAPINWAIERGDDMTGITIMRMAEGLDAGPILHMVEEPIAADETAADLAVRLSEIGAEALIEALAMIELDSIQEIEQDDAHATYAPKLTRENARIDWSRSAAEVGRHIRAMDDVPGAWSTWNGSDIKLYRPLPLIDEKHNAEPGTVIEESRIHDEEGFTVACGTGVVRVREVKPAGKRRMTAGEWIRGRGAVVGDVFR